MATQTSADLKAALVGGLIHEDVMTSITNLSKNIDTPLSDMIGRGTHGNEYYSWTQDTQATPSSTNAVLDGMSPTVNDATVGSRVGNHSQISQKYVSVSTRNDASKTIGFAKSSAYQIQLRTEDLRRDIECAMLSNNESIADTDPQVGISGGLNAWIATNHQTSGAAGGFSTGTGLVVPYTPGTARGLTEAMVRQASSDVYKQGGNASVFMAVPDLISGLSQYMFTSSSRIATLTREAPENKAGTAIMSVNVMVLDFNVTMKMIPNRVQEDISAGVSTAFVLDPAKLELSNLRGMRAERLAKTGLAENWQISQDWTLVVNDEKAHACISDITNTDDVTAG